MTKKLRGMERLAWLNKHYRVGRKRKSPSSKPQLTKTIRVLPARAADLVKQHKSHSIYPKKFSRHRWVFICRATRPKGKKDRVVVSTYLVAKLFNAQTSAHIESLSFINLGTIERYNKIRESFGLSKKETIRLLRDVIVAHGQDSNIPYEMVLRQYLTYRVAIKKHVVKIPIINNRILYLNEETMLAINNTYRSRHKIPTWANIIRLAREYGSEAVPTASL